MSIRYRRTSQEPLPAQRRARQAKIAGHSRDRLVRAPGERIKRSNWGKESERERHRRIKVAVAAYVYEILSESIMSDEDYDTQCRLVDLEQSTGDRYMDRWFKKNFDPSTGMWVHDHPNKKGLKRIASFILKRQRRRAK